MRNTVSLFLMILFTLSLSSCFDIVEEVDLKNNGSGTIKGTLNLSKSKTKVATLMKLDKIDGFKVPSQAEIRKEVETIVAILKKTEGISNVNHKLDFTNYIVNVSCDFKNVKALNAYTAALSTHFKTKLNDFSSYQYDASSKMFTRNYKNNPDSKKEFSKLSAENQKSFDNAFYTSIYRFEGTVNQQTNSAAKVSPNNKAVMTKISIPSLVNAKAGLANKISLK